MRAFALITLLSLSAGIAGAQPRIDVPELYVLATTPNTPGRSPETRVSYDGRLWSGPSYPRDSNGVPIAARTGVPAGIGTNFQKYLLAFFDTGGTLNTMESVDGLTWTNRLLHGSFNVTQHSRPAVAYDGKSSRWYVAFRQGDDHVVVRRFSAIDGQGTSADIIPGVITRQAIGFAVTDVGVPANAPHNRLLLAWRAGSIFIKQTLDPENWPAGTGTDTGLSSEAGPFLSTSFGLIRVGLTGTTRPQASEDTIQFGDPSGRLHHGTLSVVESLNDPLTSWRRMFFIDGGMTAAGFSPAFAGPRTATVAAKGNPTPNTSTWFSSGNGRVVLGATARDIATQTGMDVSMAFGQDTGTALRRITLVFRRFHRIVHERGMEDVRLEVEHRGAQRIPGDNSTRPLIARMTPWQIEDANTNATVQWSHDGQLPRFSALMHPNDQIVVRVTGDDGTVTEILSFNDIGNALRNATGDSQMDVNSPTSRPGYMVFFIAQSP